VIAPQWIGDAVMTEPLMRELAARGEALTVAALPWVAPVYRAMPSVQSVIELPWSHGGLQWKQRRKIGQSLRGQFSRAYVLPNSFKSALIPLFARIPVRVGYQGEMRLGFLSHRLPNPSRQQRPPMVAFYSALAKVAQPSTKAPEARMGGADTAGSNMAGHPQLTTGPDVVQASLDAFGLKANGYVVFAPGAEFGPAKRWPAEHFAGLARQLTLPVVLLGSDKEAVLCQTIVEAGPSVTGDHLRLNLAGKTSLDQALALISAANAMVSNDSGLMHVAASFGVPQVALYGSSSPLHTPPLNSLAHVIWLKDDPDYQPALACAPCFQRECPLGHMRCLKDISVERVLALLPHQSLVSSTL
jgi:heptosyltransferase II